MLFISFAGLGFYHLEVSLNSAHTTASLCQLINELVPSARNGQHKSPHELSFELPISLTPHFPRLFDTLEERKSELAIASYGITLTSLEEVFVNISSLRRAHTQQDEADSLLDEHKLPSPHSASERPPFTARPSALGQFKAILHTHFAGEKASSRVTTVLSMVFSKTTITFGMVLLCFFLAGLPLTDKVTQKGNVQLTASTNAVFSNSVLPFTASNATLLNLMQNAFTFTAPQPLYVPVQTLAENFPVQPFADWLLKQQSSPDRQLMSAAMLAAPRGDITQPLSLFTSADFHIFGNNTLTHAWPLALNLLHNTMLSAIAKQANIDTEFGISTTSAPFPAIVNQSGILGFLLIMGIFMLLFAASTGVRSTAVFVSCL